jgi:hypothetical protein
MLPTKTQVGTSARIEPTTRTFAHSRRSETSADRRVDRANFKIEHIVGTISTIIDIEHRQDALGEVLEQFDAERVRRRRRALDL